MSEKTTLLPSAQNDDRFVGSGHSQYQDLNQAQTNIMMPRLILAPGLEFDPARKFRYGLHSLTAAILILVSFMLVEFRDCNYSLGTNLHQLQTLHVCLMAFAFVLYLLSLFGIADYAFQFRVMFAIGVLLIYAVVGLMIWMTYEAAVTPCVKSFDVIHVDLSFEPNKNVFTRGDGVGIVVLFLDIAATLFMISAATSFVKRY